AVGAEGGATPPEPAAVGGGAAEAPGGPAAAPRGEEFAEQGAGRPGLLDLAVGPVDAGQVAEAGVAPQQHDGPAQRGLDGRQDVEAVEPERTAAQVGGVGAAGEAAGQGPVGAGAAADGHPL